MRRLFARGVVVATALALFAPVMGAAPAQAAAGTTVVLSFDDGVVNQSVVPAMLEAHGMRGTFYVNSNAIGTPGYLTWAQLVSFQAAGHEIGGHTLDHLNLDNIPVAQAQTQVCNDRTAIMSHGLTVTDFAYPYGAGYETAAVRTVVQGCGYSSARRAWGLYSTDPACGTNGCGYPYAGTVPPADPFGVETADNPQTATTLDQIETLVTQAETHGGGLVPLVFHEICAGCDPYSTTQATLQAFLDWLQPRAESGTIVKTMTQVMTGDTTAPASSIACNGAPCSSGWYGPSPQVSLSAADNAGGSGVASIRYTTDGSTPGFASSIYSAPFSLSSTKTVKYRAYDSAGNPETTKSQLVQIDAVAPTSTIQCNGSACSSVGYATPAQVTLSATDTGGAGVAAIRYTTDGTDPTSSSTVYSAPFTVSSTTTVKYRAFDNAANAEPTKSQAILLDTDAPVSSIACNGVACSGGWYGGAVQVSLSATDTGSGVGAIRYTTDGSDPTPTSPVYSAPFTVSATTTVKDRATDLTGNVEPTKTQTIQIDNVAPASTIACNAKMCSGWYHGSTQVSLSALDSGGSGVSAIRYTTDGSDPTLTSPLYSTPITVSATNTLKYRTWDNAGNEESTQSMLIKIDTIAPVATINCNAKGCSNGWYRKSAKISFSATDIGSGIASIRYTTDGSTPTAASTAYHTAFKLTTTRNFKYRAIDNAGIAGPVKTALVKIDTAGPTLTITSPRIHTFVTGTFKFSVHATDVQSGVAQLDFYLDGHLVATDTKAPYSFTWNTATMSKNTHTLTATALDTAGNTTTKTTNITVH